MNMFENRQNFMTKPNLIESALHNSAPIIFLLEISQHGSFHLSAIEKVINTLNDILPCVSPRARATARATAIAMLGRCFPIV